MNVEFDTLNYPDLFIFAFEWGKEKRGNNVAMLMIKFGIRDKTVWFSSLFLCPFNIRLLIRVSFKNW